MKIKFFVTIIPYLFLVFFKIKDGKKIDTKKQIFLNEGILFILPLFGLFFDNILIMMTLFIISTVLASLYRLHTLKSKKITCDIKTILHIMYYLIPILIEIIIYNEKILIYEYLILGIFIYLDCLYKILLNKIFNKKKIKKRR